MRGILLFSVAVLLLSAVGCEGGREQREVILATTTSTYDSGLLDVLIPLFEKQGGYKVKPIAVGTGQALALGERGETDVLLVHSPRDERALVEKGLAVNRRMVMHNSFALVGPREDPADIGGVRGTTLALKKIAEARALFISRGDDSGTHKMEKDLWKKTGIQPSGRWYQETGQGMGATLRVASEKEGYTLTDWGTFLALKKSLNLEVMVAGDPSLLNIYSVMQVNPERFPKVNASGGKAFADFMVSPQAQEVIRDFGVKEFGEPLFFPDAGKREEELMH